VATTRATDVVLDIASAHRAKVGSANHQIPLFEEQFTAKVRVLVDGVNVRLYAASTLALAVTGDEQLLIALNRSILTILATNAESATSRIKAAIELLRSLGSQPRKEGVDTLPIIEGIPDAAVAGLGRWVISDDAEREEALAAASSTDLSALAAFLDTWADALRTALPRLDQSDPEAAVIWGSLAETAAEAQTEIRRRDE
jgi:hypothetical protein